MLRHGGPAPRGGRRGTYGGTSGVWWRKFKTTPQSHCVGMKEEESTSVSLASSTTTTDENDACSSSCSASSTRPSSSHTLTEQPSEEAGQDEDSQLIIPQVSSFPFEIVQQQQYQEEDNCSTTSIFVWDDDSDVNLSSGIAVKMNSRGGEDIHEKENRKENRSTRGDAFSLLEEDNHTPVEVEQKQQAQSSLSSSGPRLQSPPWMTTAAVPSKQQQHPRRSLRRKFFGGHLRRLMTMVATTTTEASLLQPEEEKHLQQQRRLLLLNNTEKPQVENDTAITDKNHAQPASCKQKVKQGCHENDQKPNKKRKHNKQPQQSCCWSPRTRQEIEYYRTRFQHVDQHVKLNIEFSSNEKKPKRSASAVALPQGRKFNLI